MFLRYFTKIAKKCFIWKKRSFIKKKKRVLRKPTVQPFFKRLCTINGQSRWRGQNDPVCTRRVKRIGLIHWSIFLKKKTEMSYLSYLCLTSLWNILLFIWIVQENLDKYSSFYYYYNYYLVMFISLYTHIYLLMLVISLIIFKAKYTVNFHLLRAKNENLYFLSIHKLKAKCILYFI